jgi:hypothetical protein
VTSTCDLNLQPQLATSTGNLNWQPQLATSTGNLHQAKPHGTFKLVIGGGLDGPIAALELAILPAGLARSIGQQTSRTDLLWRQQLLTS